MSILRLTPEQLAAHQKRVKTMSGGVEGHAGNAGKANRRVSLTCGAASAGTAGIKPGPLTKYRREPPIAGVANAQDRPSLKAQEGPKTGAGRDFPASGVQSPKKYRNRPTGAYSSRKEARRAEELKLMEKAGQIRNLREQVEFELIPAQYVDGKLVERACRYTADFCYDEPHASLNGDIRWWPVTEDAKGVRTKDYVIKRKLMLWLKGIRVRET